MELLQGTLAAILTSALVTTIVNVVLGQWAVTRQARRDRYSNVVGTLVARIELPYRIRRRTDDEVGTLHALSERFHANQEQIVADEAWVAADSQKVLGAWKAVRKKVDPWLNEQAQLAWLQNPVSAGAAMNLDPPLQAPEVQAELAALQTQISRATVWWRL